MGAGHFGGLTAGTLLTLNFLPVLCVSPGRFRRWRLESEQRSSSGSGTEQLPEETARVAQNTRLSTTRSGQLFY